MGFIEEIAPLIKKYAPQYGVEVISPIIAQAVLESASGTSELAKNAHNYFGLKWHKDVTSIYYVKNASEQRPDGTYYTVNDTRWCKFNSIEEGVKGYFDFLFRRTGITRYNGLKGITDPYMYLLEIKSAGYATSLKYVDNLMEVIKKYNLTQYDAINANPSATRKMTINVHAGHNPDGMTACGAIGIIKESTYNRFVKDKVVEFLRYMGHTVYDCTCNDGTSVTDVLNKIVAKCNAHTVDLDVSIHFNAGGGKGTEVLVYSTTSKSFQTAAKIVKAISELGFVNRGIKERPELSVLKRTKAPALLVECCFVDSKEDTDRLDIDKMARAIVRGITGAEPTTEDQNYVVCPHCGQKIYL